MPRALSVVNSSSAWHINSCIVEFNLTFVCVLCSPVCFVLTWGLAVQLSWHPQGSLAPPTTPSLPPTSAAGRCTTRQLLVSNTHTAALLPSASLQTLFWFLTVHLIYRRLCWASEITSNCCIRGKLELLMFSLRR